MTTKSDRAELTQNGSARGAEPLPPAAALLADGSSSTVPPGSGGPTEDASGNGESAEPGGERQRDRAWAESVDAPGSLGKPAARHYDSDGDDSGDDNSDDDNSDDDDSDDDDSDDDDSDDENRAGDAVRAERDPRRPAFLDELADIAELRPLVAAFVGGNYALLRQLERSLPRQTSDPETLALARELVERTQPDPLSKAILGLSVLFFLFIVGWVYLHHAQ